jgi:hypothetical protein
LYEFVVCIASELQDLSPDVLSLTINSPVTILISLADHFINFVVGQLFANGCHNMSKFSRRDEAVVVAIEDLERFLQLSAI